MSKREAQKNRSRTLILNAAKQIFLNEGYHAATTKKISQLAGVGEGTIYNHFRNKSDMLVCIYEELVFNPKHELKYESQKHQQAFDYVIEFFDYYWSSTRNISKEWLRELFSSVYKTSDDEEHIYKKLSDVDQLWLDQLSKYMSCMQEDGLIPVDLDLYKFIMLIYTIVIQNYSTYAVSSELDYCGFRKMCIEQLDFLFGMI